MAATERDGLIGNSRIHTESPLWRMDRLSAARHDELTYVEEPKAHSASKRSCTQNLVILAMVHPASWIDRQIQAL